MTFVPLPSSMDRSSRQLMLHQSQPLDYQTRSSLSKQRQRTLSRFLRRPDLAQTDLLPMHIAGLGDVSLNVDEATTGLGLERVRRLAMFTVQLAKEIDTDLLQALLPGLGVGVWWALEGEIFLWRLPVGTVCPRTGWMGLSAGFHPLVLDVDESLLIRLGQDGWPTYSPLDVTFSMRPRPLWGRGGSARILPSHRVLVETYWAS